MGKTHHQPVQLSYPTPFRRDGHDVSKLHKNPEPFGVSIGNGHTSYRDSENTAKNVDAPEYASEMHLGIHKGY